MASTKSTKAALSDKEQSKAADVASMLGPWAHQGASAVDGRGGFGMGTEFYRQKRFTSGQQVPLENSHISSIYLSMKRRDFP